MAKGTPAPARWVEGCPTYQNGDYVRSLATRRGTPKLRQASCIPAFLEPRRTLEKALVAVIQEA
ncbi:hypothetical protein LNKW23_02030 [Paralimibaculum aggregatum]|uniref:Uncharacterized protein n=1 Tax=Paralimibaculum aggregatum TaxID=3036245 RepID=A0ABQ6LKT0_9RHOB|nr:hypothetical protein LNKW23_02030 [Limibaculum sp. NKW23]